MCLEVKVFIFFKGVNISCLGCHSKMKLSIHIHLHEIYKNEGWIWSHFDESATCRGFLIVRYCFIYLTFGTC